MKKLLIIIAILSLITIIGMAKLSDETLEEVNDLRWKHYGYGSITLDYTLFLNADTLEWTRDFLSIKVEGDRLIIETQDGKWFIEMEKIEEKED